MLQEHERAAGSWQSEWEPMLELLRLTGSAAEALSELVDGLAVDVERMRANLDLSGEQLMSESVAGALGASLGRSRAQELVARASRQAAREHRRLRDVLLEVPEVAECLSSASLDRALDPRHYLGVTSELIDRTLAAHARLLDDDAEA
jgi:3-carboxy-cis,cis-muconate cycloisomerase